MTLKPFHVSVIQLERSFEKTGIEPNDCEMDTDQHTENISLDYTDIWCRPSP